MSRLIGIAGPSRSGKDTAATATGFTKVAFADPLRELAERLDPLVRVNGGTRRRYSDLLAVEGYEWVKDNTDARDFLVGLGAGVRDILGLHTWVDAAMSRVDRLMEKGRSVVVPDVRYINEALAIQQRGGEVWYIEREGCVFRGEEAYSLPPVRAQADLRITNNLSVTSLQQQVAILSV